MRPGVDIRRSDVADEAAIARLYRDAFPDEDLLPLVSDLLCLTAGVLSMVATRANEVVGHVVFTDCTLVNCGGSVALLGPLAVARPLHRQGIGTALVRDGLAHLARRGPVRVLVLGDPRYYARLGFETEMHVAPPFPLIEDWLPAWQSLDVGAASPAIEGRLIVPGPWMRPGLWTP
ncbi:MAG: N-acetyltransferase [Hyphomicrobiaceae bacterium]